MINLKCNIFKLSKYSGSIFRGVDNIFSTWIKNIYLYYYYFNDNIIQYKQYNNVYNL